MDQITRSRYSPQFHLWLLGQTLSSIFVSDPGQNQGCVLCPDGTVSSAPERRRDHFSWHFIFKIMFVCGREVVLPLMVRRDIRQRRKHGRRVRCSLTPNQDTKSTAVKHTRSMVKYILLKYFVCVCVCVYMPSTYLCVCVYFLKKRLRVHQGKSENTRQPQNPKSATFYNYTVTRWHAATARHSLTSVQTCTHTCNYSLPPQSH